MAHIFISNNGEAEADYISVNSKFEPSLVYVVSFRTVGLFQRNPVLGGRGGVYTWDLNLNSKVRTRSYTFLIWKYMAITGLFIKGSKKGFSIPDRAFIHQRKDFIQVQFVNQCVYWYKHHSLDENGSWQEAVKEY